MDNLTRARAIMLLSNPFFGSLLLRMKMEPDDSVQTTMCDGRRIRYNPKLIDTLPLNKAIGLLAATTMHMVMLHHFRRQGRDPAKWNMACDLAVEHTLREVGIDLPQNNPCPQSFQGMSAERIYEQLPDNLPQPQSGGGGTSQPQSRQDPGGNGAVEDSPDPNPEQAESEMRSMVAQAAQQAQSMGMLPGKLKELVAEALRPVVHWESALRKFMTSKRPDNFTWSRGNRRFIAQGLYLPSVSSTPTGKVALFIDVSGSVSSRWISTFLRETRAIYEDVKPEEMLVITCDARVQGVFHIEDSINIKITGRGGTDFRPPFQWLKDHNIEPQCAIYLTDGDGPFPNEHDIPYPVLWCINNEQTTPPWGDHLVVPAA